MLHYENLQLYLRLGLKLKKIHRVLDSFNIQKTIEAEKNNDKDGKALHKLINNAVYRKTMENVLNKINVKQVNNGKDYLKCTSKPSYMSHKIFHNNLVAIRKSKLALKLNKPTYTRMCTFKLSKVLMYEFQYDYIKSKYDNKKSKNIIHRLSLMYSLMIV